jgi:hypothetical protein
MAPTPSLKPSPNPHNFIYLENLNFSHRMPKVCWGVRLESRPYDILGLLLIFRPEVLRFG